MTASRRPTPAPAGSSSGRRRRRWRFSALNLTVALALLGGMTLLTYPTAAAWMSQYNQSNIAFDQTLANSEHAKDDLDNQLAEAREYNDLLQSGALLRPGANVAEGTGAPGKMLDYWKTLAAGPTDVMVRLRVPSIDLDLPVYHGTSDETLLKGVGHLQGTSLPVGGIGTRSVLTGHRGLASSTLFTNLDQVKENDTFSVQVLGEVLTYHVVKIEVVEPDATEEIRPVAGKDLMTLVTCTPLGINTQRILITGKRITPTPTSEIEAMTQRPTVPGFPWWIVFYTAGLVTITIWFKRSGYPSKRATAAGRNPKGGGKQ